jgi:hypothetical protein
LEKTIFKTGGLMKQTVTVLLVLMMASTAWAVKDISIGAFGGLNIPIVQDDAASGSGFGGKAKFSPIPMLAGAIYFESRTFGDPELEVQGMTLSTDGGNVTSFGVEALIGNTGGGPGPHFYWTFGLSSYKWSRDGQDDLSEVGYHLGPGFEFVLPAKIGLEGRAKFEIVPTDGGGSRKNVLVFIGLNYHIGLPVGGM